MTFGLWILMQRWVAWPNLIWEDIPARMQDLLEALCKQMGEEKWVQGPLALMLEGSDYMYQPESNGQ